MTELITQTTINQLITQVTSNRLVSSGTQGPPGVPGPEGNTILNGIIPPDNSLGNNGDFYIDTVGVDLYGPKAAGVWPAGISLIGTGSTIPPSSGVIPFTATIAWNGTSPSGTTNHSYIWQKIGRFVFAEVRLDYSVAGSLVSQVDIDLPSDMPAPQDLTNVGNTNIVLSGSVIMSLDLVLSTMAGRAFMNKNSSSASGYRIRAIGNTSGSYRGLVMSFSYAAQNE